LIPKKPFRKTDLEKKHDESYPQKNESREAAQENTKSKAPEIHNVGLV